ncbi:NUDIX domain-containing protein [Anaerocolumna sedimenticola]|uniref:NUDIX domain-containing protein n=1 Tax=Anaerocolumna sedimenticola TaxID=2696063 RepID=A0A6P1TTW9_9FIRM|nr:NUDIX domain-containing protein [Anaerocolumna sedimenticola]
MKINPCYYTVGGAVKIKETSEEAVIREVYEETGVNFEIDRLVFIQERFLNIPEKLRWFN